MPSLHFIISKLYVYFSEMQQYNKFLLKFDNKK